MGGEGGGVLAGWIVDIAEHGDYIAQLTSVPGVAQRTGATIYYLELFPKAAVQAGSLPPVLALMPVPGDVDIVIASELMEAARAVERGFVTPERTALIASTHRVFSMTEKTAMADGRTEASTLLDACRTAARLWIAFDMQILAERTGSIISAALLGALCRSGVLPFGTPDFEAAIVRSGTGVERSLAAFRLALSATGEDPVAAPREDRSINAELRDYPQSVQQVIAAGYDRLLDYQDSSYAALYLARLRPLIEIDRRHGDGSLRLLSETARYLALGMSYEDTIRVSELKIRPERLTRIRNEVDLSAGQILEIAEFLHPRLQEIAESVPATLGNFLLRNPLARRTVEALTARGRVVKTSSVSGYLLLRAVASLKPWRRTSLRYAAEQKSLEEWLAKIIAIAPSDYDLAVELALSRNLVKGYGSTHDRGTANYHQIVTVIERLKEKPGAAALAAQLRRSALADEDGEEFKKAISRLSAV